MLKTNFRKFASKQEEQEQKIAELASILKEYITDEENLIGNEKQWTAPSALNNAFHKAVTFISGGTAKMWDFRSMENTEYGTKENPGPGNWMYQSEQTLNLGKGTVTTALSYIKDNQKILENYSKFAEAKYPVDKIKEYAKAEATSSVQAATAPAVSGTPTTPAAAPTEAPPAAGSGAASPASPAAPTAEGSPAGTLASGKTLKGGIATILKFIDTGLLKLDIKGLDFTAEKKRTQAFILASGGYEQAADKIIEHGNLSTLAKNQLATADGMDLEELKGSINGDLALLRSEQATGFNAKNRPPTLYVTAGIMEMFQFISTKFVEANGRVNIFTNAQEAADKMKKFLHMFGGKSKAEIKAERASKKKEVAADSNSASDHLSTRAFKLDIMNKVASRRERVRKEMMTPETPTEAAMMRRVKVRNY